MANFFNTNRITADFTLNLTDYIKSGLQKKNQDPPVPYWEVMDGIQFDNASLIRKPGRTEITGSPSVTEIRGLVATNEFGTKTLYSGDLSSIHRFTLDDTAYSTVGTGYSLIESAGASEWDSGTSIWDGGSSVWDEGSNEPTRWSFVRYGTWVYGAFGNGFLVTKKDYETFTNLNTTDISRITITGGGTGHVVGDVIDFTGGTGTGLTIEVTEVDTGAVTGFKVTDYGSGYTDSDSLTQNTTTGTGTDLTLDVFVSGCPFTNVKMMTSSGPHLLVANFSKESGDFPYDFAWSDRNNPDDWNPTSVNTAGSLTIREATSPIKALVPLGRGVGAYTETQMFFIEQTGYPFYFGYRPVLHSGTGAMSIDSVIPVDRLNYGLCKNGFFVTDGEEIKNLGEVEGINDYVLDNLATTESSNITGIHDAKEKEVIWSIPFGTTQLNKEIFYNYEYGTWGERSNNYSAFLEQSVFDHITSGDTDGLLFFEDGGPVSSTSGVTSCTSVAIDFDNADNMKELSLLRVRKTGEGSPVVSLGWTDYKDNTPSFDQNYTLNQDNNTFFLRTAGRFLTIKISSDSPTDTWRINHLSLSGRVRGTR